MNSASIFGFALSSIALLFATGCEGAKDTCEQDSCGSDGACQCEDGKDGVDGAKGDKGDKGDPGPPGMDGEDGVCLDCEGGGSGDGGFITNCPDDFSRVGKPGKRGSFCITQQHQPEDEFFVAKQACWSMPTSTGDHPHMCTITEWFTACQNGSDVGQPAITGMDDSQVEWIPELTSTGSAVLAGYSGKCDKFTSATFSTENYYRCCLD